MQQPNTIPGKITKPLARRTIAQVPWPLRLRRKVDRKKCCRCTKKKYQRNCHTLPARNENLLPNVMVVVVDFTIMNTFVYPYEARTDMWTVCLLFSCLLRALCSVVCRWPMFGTFLTSKMLFIVVVDAGQWIGVNPTSYNGNRRLTEPNFRAALIKYRSTRSTRQYFFLFKCLYSWNRGRAKIEFRLMPDEYTIRSLTW